jgi:hypothetical protein
MRKRIKSKTQKGTQRQLPSGRWQAVASYFPKSLLTQKPLSTSRVPSQLFRLLPYSECRLR